MQSFSSLNYKAIKNQQLCWKTVTFELWSTQILMFVVATPGNQIPLYSQINTNQIAPSRWATLKTELEHFQFYRKPHDSWILKFFDRLRTPFLRPILRLLYANSLLIYVRKKVEKKCAIFMPNFNFWGIFWFVQIAEARTHHYN